MNEILEYLRQREEALLDPRVRRDRARVEQLLADDFKEFGSSGIVWTREQIFDLLATEIYAPPEVQNFTCTMLSETVALVTYYAVRRGTAADDLSSSLRSSIWTKNDRGGKPEGSWVLRFHQGTRTS